MKKILSVLLTAGLLAAVTARAEVDAKARKIIDREIRPQLAVLHDARSGGTQTNQDLIGFTSYGSVQIGSGTTNAQILSLPAYREYRVYALDATITNNLAVPGLSALHAYVDIVNIGTNSLAIDNTRIYGAPADILIEDQYDSIGLYGYSTSMWRLVYKNQQD